MRMPIEFTILEDATVPLQECSRCGCRPFRPFLRGQVQRARRWFGLGPRRPYCALICSVCKSIVGYEYPPQVRP